MSRRKTRTEEIRNKEHYFNSFISTEIRRDKKISENYQRRFPSLEEMIDYNEHANATVAKLLAVNSDGELLERYIADASLFGWIDLIENQCLYTAISLLPYEDKLFLTLRFKKELDQAELAGVFGLHQSNISRWESRLKNFFEIFSKRRIQNLDFIST